MVWLCTLFASVSIYYLTIVYLNEYINAGTIDEEFMRKVGVIVLLSAGVLIAIEKVGGCIWPSYTKLVLNSLPPMQATHPEEAKQTAALEVYREDDSAAKEGQRLLD